MQDQALAPALLRIFAQVLAAAGFGAPATTVEKVADAPKFYSVSEAAALFGISPMGLYRAIHAGKFPAVRVGTRRYFVPAAAIREMAESAVGRGLVDAADWVEADPRSIAIFPSSGVAV